MKFSERLKQYRIKTGLTAAEFASRAGLTPSTYRNYESGKAEPKYKFLVQIADALNVSLDDLLGRENVEYQKAVSFFQAAGVKVEGREDKEHRLCNIVVLLNNEDNKFFNNETDFPLLIFHDKSSFLKFANDIKQDFQSITAPDLYGTIQKAVSRYLWEGYGNTRGLKRDIDDIAHSRPPEMNDKEFIANIAFSLVLGNVKGPLLLHCVKYAKETYCNNGDGDSLTPGEITTISKTAARQVHEFMKRERTDNGEKK